MKDGKFTPGPHKGCDVCDREVLAERLRVMPSSLNDALRTINMAQDRIERLEAAIRIVLNSNPYNRQQAEMAMEYLAAAIGEKVGPL